MYIDILPLLRDAVRTKRPEKWRSNCWFLLHDNAPTHRLVLVKDVLSKNNVTTLEHPPYSSGLSSPDCICSLDWNQHRRDGAFAVLLRYLRMRRKSWKCFRKTASSYVSNTFTYAGRNVYLHKGTIWKEIQIKWLYPFAFIRNKVFSRNILKLPRVSLSWKHFCACAYSTKRRKDITVFLIYTLLFFYS
jgi:hypothetical protein